MSDKIYLGDSVYANWTGYSLVLTTENGFGPSNTIELDETVWANLVDYIEALKVKARAAAHPEGER